MSDTRVSLPVTVMFVDDGDGTRSLLSAALLDHLGATVGENRFRSVALGTQAGASLSAEARTALEARDIPAGTARAGASAAQLDAVGILINLSEDEGFAPDVRPGAGVVEAHWPVVDPMGFGTDAARADALSDVLEICWARVDHLVRLPTASLEERQAIQTIATNAKPDIHPEDYPASYGVTTRPEPG